MIWPFRKSAAPDARAMGDVQSFPVSKSGFFEVMGWGNTSSAGENVTVDTALGVPAIWAAVNFIPATLAGLPCHVYRRTPQGRERVASPLARVLHDAVNDEMSSFAWRKWIFEQVLTVGRGVTFIERNARGQVINLWPLETQYLTIRRRQGRKFYEYRESGRDAVTYEASEVIDLTFMLRSDGLTHRSPILANREAIGLAQAVTKYGGKFFADGGIPAFAVEGDFQSEQAMRRAMADLDRVAQKAAMENRNRFALPRGLKITTLGFDLEKMQLVDVQRFCVEQIGRIYSLPPTFLQDLTHGTFSNTEQQDLHFVKHTLKRWVEDFEQELNLKLFGRGAGQQYVELNMDGLLRGDFKTRMEAYATGIQNGVLMPNEARRAENRTDEEGGDRLYIQGATVPLTSAGQVAPGETEGDDNDAPE